MTAEQKLDRAITKLIYEFFEDACNAYYPEAYSGENEDHLLIAIHRLKLMARKYHRDFIREEQDAMSKRLHEFMKRDVKEHPERWKLQTIDINGIELPSIDVDDFKWYNPKYDKPPKK